MNRTHAHVDRPGGRRRHVRLAGMALVATTAIGTLGTTAHADGKVDLDVWVATYRDTAASDFDGDGVVDGADFLVWQRHTVADHDPDGWIIIQSTSSPIRK